MNSAVSTEYKQLGTVETLSVLLEHRKILSECIKNMDEQGVNYISEEAIFVQLKRYTALMPRDVKRRLSIAFTTQNLLQANIVMDVDSSQAEQRLYFQTSVLDVIRLCDVSLYKKLTDVRLKTHLQFLNQAHAQLTSGEFNFLPDDDDFAEFMDHLLMQIGHLVSDIRQNVTKMQALGKELESMTAQSVKQSTDSEGFIKAKQEWLDQIVHLYERHVIPVLHFLNPDTTYEGMAGLHRVLQDIAHVLSQHEHGQFAQTCQAQGLSLLNFYRPIEHTAQAVNRYIHKQRDSIKRFNAVEYFYQNRMLTALREAQSERLNKSKFGNDALVLPEFVSGNRGFRRPMGYALKQSSAYYKNLFNELNARTQDILNNSQLSRVFGEARKDPQAEALVLRFTELCEIVSQVQLRPCDDVTAVLHQRLCEDFVEYQVYDLISAVQVVSQGGSQEPGEGQGLELGLSNEAIAAAQYQLITTNHFAEITHNGHTYRYRRIICQSHGAALQPPQGLIQTETHA